MPFRDLEFSVSRRGGRPAFRLSFAGKAATALVDARRSTPVHLAGNLAVVHGFRGRAPEGLWPSTVFAATVQVGAGLDRVPGAAFTARPAYPALIEYRTGFCAFAAQDGHGETVVVCAGSPAAALSLDPAVASALPDGTLSMLHGAASRFRARWAGLMADAAASPGAAAALAILEDPRWHCIAGRGETDDAAVWTFADGDGRYAVAGVARQSSTLTVLFPFAGGRRMAAEWVDDALPYYVREGLEIRPTEVLATTKAVVKTARGGGFAVVLSPIDAR